MKCKIISVGDFGTFMLPVPQTILDVLGWKEGDLVDLDLPVTGGTILLSKPEPYPSTVAYDGRTDKSREVV